MRSLIFLVLATTLGAAEGERAEDRAALAALLNQATTALNTQQFADLVPLLTPTYSLTFLDQTVVTDVTGLESAFARWLGPETDLVSVTFAPRTTDGPHFLGPDSAYAAGISDDLYTLKDGRSGVMPSTWTASVQRIDGVWRIATVHVGIDPQRNVLVDTLITGAKRLAIWGALIAGLLGVVLGFGLGRLTRRA